MTGVESAIYQSEEDPAPVTSSALSLNATKGGMWTVLTRSGRIILVDGGGGNDWSG